MKAVVLNAPGGPENLQLAEIETPLPARDEVRIRIHAAGFNPADYKMRVSGIPRVPILGGEVAGVIDAIGAGVTDFRVGQAVCAYLPLKRGGYAEAVCTYAAFVALKPDTLSFVEAAALPLAGLTAMWCVAKHPGLAGAPVFIAGGSGGVGSLAIGIARVKGASRIITTAGSDASAQYLTRVIGMSADSIARYDRIGSHALADSIRAMNGGLRFPLALDFVGGRMTTLCCELVDFDGLVTSIVQRPDNDAQELLASKCAAARYVGLRTRAQHNEPAVWLAYRKDLQEVLDLVSRGAVPLPHIQDVGALAAETVRTAHRLLEQQHVQGKLVMSVP